MGIMGRSLYLGVAEQLSGHRQVFAEFKGVGRK
jgi:hypothetical protein